MATKLRPWADTGTKIKPADAKIDQGWVAGEQPPAEWENERMNTRDATINTIIDEVDQLDVDLTDLESRLADNTTTVDGASLIGVHEIIRTPDSIVTGDLRQTLLSLLTDINERARIASDEEITGDWGFTGQPSIMTGTIGLKDIHHEGRRACIQSYSNTDNKQGIIHPYNNQSLSFLGGEHTDPCAIVDPDRPGRYLVVMVETNGSQFHWLGLEDDTYFTRNITGLTAGVTEVCSACSDGDDLYILVRRSGGNDTVAKVVVSTGAVAWEQNLPVGNSLAGFPYDRIIAGDTISTTPWVVELYIINGAMTLQTSGVIRKIRSDTGATMWDGNAPALTTKQPHGGLAHSGDFVAMTTGVEDGTVATLANFDATTGAYSSGVNMAVSGSSLSDAALDLVYDGRKFAWVSYSGYYRYFQPLRTNRWPALIENDSSVILADGLGLVFDGVNIWAATFNDTQFKINLHKIHAAGLRSDYKQYPLVVDTTTGWSPHAAPWDMGRGCRVGPHVVFSCPVPGTVTSRAAIMTIFNSATWT